VAVAVALVTALGGLACAALLERALERGGPLARRRILGPGQGPAGPYGAWLGRLGAGGTA
jgi:hypothetical protein